MPYSEAVTIAFIILVGCITTAALYVGLLGLLGAIHVVDCRSCHHQTFSFGNQPSRSCPQCRHPLLLHPLRFMRRHHTSESVVRD
jgi:hypothetical protein